MRKAPFRIGPPVVGGCCDLPQGGSGRGRAFGRIPRCASSSVFHVVQVDFECPYRNLDFADGDAERADQRQQTRTEDVCGHKRQPDVEQEHRHDAQEQAGDPQNLHGAGQVEPPPQVVDLGGRQVGTVLEVLRFERADQLGVGEKPVGVGQQDQ